MIGALVITFVHANNTVQREVSKQGKRGLLPLAVIALNIMACVWFVYYMCGEKQLYYSLLLIPPNSAPITLSNLLWTVTTTDHILKLATVLCKAALTFLPVGLFPISRRVYPKRLVLKIVYRRILIHFGHRRENISSLRRERLNSIAPLPPFRLGSTTCSTIHQERDPHSFSTTGLSAFASAQST